MANTMTDSYVKETTYGTFQAWVCWRNHWHKLGEYESYADATWEIREWMAR